MFSLQVFSGGVIRYLIAAGFWGQVVCGSLNNAFTNLAMLQNVSEAALTTAFSTEVHCSGLGI